MKFLLLLLLGISLHINAFAQTQLGQDIDGEAVNDNSGESVSISADGTVVAIGASNNDGNGDSSGHVRVYGLTGGSWSQLGGDIDGEAVSDASGRSVSLSADGTVVAIGAFRNDGNGSSSGHVRVYEFTGGSWSQMGGDIDGEAAQDMSGLSISLSADGTVVAIGASDNDGSSTDSGQVRVYGFTAGSWSQLGSDIDGETTSDFSGKAVALSGDGTVVAIGAPNNDGNGLNSGHVRVYGFTGGNWSQLGSDIDGEAASDFSGAAVSLNTDGTVVAIGAGSSDNGNLSGHVRVFDFTGGSWSQMGSDIDGEAEGDTSGSSRGTVSLNAGGTIVAIGAQLNDGNGNTSGHVRVFGFAGGSWSQIGNDIDGEAEGDFSGGSVSLSADGAVVAIGAIFNDGNGESSGHVRVYSLGTLGVEDNKLSTLTFFPNPVKDFVTINNPTGLELVNYKVYDVLGRLVQEADLFDQNTINLSNLKSASYLVVITSENGRIVKQLVKK